MELFKPKKLNNVKLKRKVSG